ncbi:MAG: hypothetical protein ILP16_06520 [Spirochaetales bacterium]|nr:hypothetical protein [Spirochaetales bacterium]
MKKLIPLLVICLAVLCFFSSCGQFEELLLEGTWKFDYKEGLYYYTYRIVFSGDQVQFIKTRYKDSMRRFVDATDATEPFPYTIEADGVVTVNYSVGVMKEIDITDTFTPDEALQKLIWKRGYYDEEYVIEQESDEKTFISPVRWYEQYMCNVVMYWEPGEEVTIDTSSLFLYSDGEYSWEGSGRTVSSGHWEKSASEPSKVSLIPNGGWTFSRMDLEYIVDSPTASHLQVNNIQDDNLDLFSGFDKYLYSWYVEFYR